MGRWFSKYFIQKNRYSVFVYDTKKSYDKSSSRIVYCNCLKECVEDADYVIVSVPVGTTSSMVKECASLMKPHSTLLEIASIKKDAVKSLTRVRKSIIPISIHPMFGPGARRLNDSKILLVPVRDVKKEKRKLLSILGDAKILVIKNASYHDKLMARILGIVYYANLVIAIVLSKDNFPELKKFSGTTFSFQSILFHSILSDEPDLISSLLIRNTESRIYLKSFIKESNNLFSMIMSQDYSKLEKKVREMKSQFMNNNEVQASYKKMYRFSL
ncbi:MAG: prephenate dehydrogenase/arogenate dehydrogenase family protein [Thermoproteota archaeon]|nr:prephenate dehydrogenase/arogenate dehydrogenase family protein [Thermoproteota archaeon]